MNIVETLTREHREILELVNAFKKGKGFEDTAWREKLFAAKKLFLHHLEEEDSVLYPALREAGKSDPEIADIAERYIAEMEKISSKVISFLDRYAVEQGGPSFSRDYAELVNLLEKRISSEEQVLFERYRKAFGY